MEPSALLIYLACASLVIITLLLSIILYQVIFLFQKINRVVGYINHTRELFLIWEELPIKVLRELQKKWFS